MSISGAVLSSEEEKIVALGDTSSICSMIQLALEKVVTHPDSAKLLNEKVLVISVKTFYKKGIIYSLINLGRYYSVKGLHKTALQYYSIALFWNRYWNYSVAKTALIYNNIGVVYSEQGNSAKAVRIFFNAVIYCRAHKLWDELPRLYNNICSVLENNNNLEQAVFYCWKGIEVAKQRRHYEDLSYLLINQANLFERLGKKDSTLILAKQAMETSRRVNNNELLQLALLKLADSYREKDSNSSAEYYYKKAFRLSLPGLTHRGTVYSHRQYGVFLANNKGNPAEAEKHFLVAMEAAKELNSIELQELLEESLAFVYEALGDYKKANFYLRSFQNIKDSLENIQQKNTVAALEAKYSSAEKAKQLIEKELLIAKQQNFIQNRNIVIFSLAGAVFLLIGFGVFYYKNKQKLQKRQLQLTSWRAMIEGEEKERARIARDLHDGIGGLLSSAKMFFGTIQKSHSELLCSKDYQKAMDLLEDTLGEVRQTAHNLMPELLLRLGLPEAIRIYCRNISEIQVDFQYYGFIGRFDNSFELMIYRIVQELIQNILKHSQAQEAVVQFSLHNDLFSITVEDYGIGFETETIEMLTGIGLANIKQRVAYMKGIMQVHSSTGNGTTVYIEFNLKNSKKLSDEYQDNYSR
jgi:signal transduction histidine kinase